MSRSSIVCGAALLALCTHSLAAQAVQPTQPVVPVLGLSVGTMNFDAASAATSQVGERAYGLQLDAGALMRGHYYLGLDLGGQFLDDHAEFTQNTTGGRKKSTSNVTYFSAIAGVRSGMPAAAPVALGLNVGASLTMGRRSIDNCEDCHVDKLDIPGGAFVEPMLVVGRGTTRFRAVDRIYGSGGMRNLASVGVELSLGKKR